MMKRLIYVVVCVLLASFLWSGASEARKKAPATVHIRIDISSQSMSVNVGGWPRGRWKVSTARAGYHTPRGSWRPYLLKKMHYSQKYDNSPMPNSIFFLGGYAIHGTGYLKSLGRPASHGCIRLHPSNARALYSIVQRHGRGATWITITN